MTLAKSQKSLKAWSKQDWGTKSGKKSSETGERYLPKKAREALSDSEYAATTAAKRKDKAAGKQHSPQPKKIAKNLLETTCPLNIKSFWSKSPPVRFQPLKLSHSYITFKTSIGFWEEVISTTVVLSLLEALRKKNKPIASKTVSNNVELIEYASISIFNKIYHLDSSVIIII